MKKIKQVKNELMVLLKDKKEAVHVKKTPSKKIKLLKEVILFLETNPKKKTFRKTAYRNKRKNR